PTVQVRSARRAGLRDGRMVGKAELLAWLAESFSTWWLPDDVVFLPAIPRTSTGKFLKSALRASLRGHYGGGG
ncbi:MAG: AMP-binding enzyme, partial [Gemmatimonadales bacterium]